MRGKELGDGGRGMGVRPRRKTGGRREWDARYTNKCSTKFMSFQVICCISFEWSRKALRMRGLKDRRLKWDGDAGRARKRGVKKPTRKRDVLSRRIGGKWKKVRLLTRMEVGAAGEAGGGR